MDADYKKAQERETSLNLWNMLQRLQEKQSGSYRTAAGQVPGSQQRL
jgi:hypothetical protein